MATIQENRKNGKLVSYKFTACVGRDANGNVDSFDCLSVFQKAA